MRKTGRENEGHPSNLISLVSVTKFQGTKVETSIPELFVGHYSNYVECLNVDYTSSRKQPYMEIQLDVHGCKDIYESLERFCEKETLEGQNKYDAKDFGLQVRP